MSAAILARLFTLVLPIISITIVVAGYSLAKLRFRELRSIGLLTRMGTSSWKFNESWASTLTAVGAILGLILAAEVIPKQPQTFSTTTYVMLNLLFSAGIVAATLTYNAIRWPKNVDVFDKGRPMIVDEERVQTTENQGFVLVFLVASSMTLWALFGQLLTTWLLLDEITRPLSPFVETFTRIVIPLSAFLTAVYGIASIPWTLINQTNRKGRNKDWIMM
ncbi:MAG: hypothetical protein H0U55_15060 [Rubrobacteraceae bacterium]|nr:hypothetical protein [Rubrobacteraceae bacterium]